MNPAHTSRTSRLEDPISYYLPSNFYCNENYGSSCGLPGYDIVLQSGSTWEETFLRNIRVQFLRIFVDYRIPRDTAAHPKTKPYS
jgi:hypothetical protein